MLDVAAPDPTGDPGTLNSIPAQFLSPGFIQEGLRRRLRYMQFVAFCSPLACTICSASASAIVVRFLLCHHAAVSLMTGRLTSIPPVLMQTQASAHILQISRSHFVQCC